MWRIIDYMYKIATIILAILTIVIFYIDYLGKVLNPLKIFTSIAPWWFIISLILGGVAIHYTRKYWEFYDEAIKKDKEAVINNLKPFPKPLGNYIQIYPNPDGTYLMRFSVDLVNLSPYLDVDIKSGAICSSHSSKLLSVDLEIDSIKKVFKQTVTNVCFRDKLTEQEKDDFLKPGKDKGYLKLCGKVMCSTTFKPDFPIYIEIDGVRIDA